MALRRNYATHRSNYLDPEPFEMAGETPEMAASNAEKLSELQRLRRTYNSKPSDLVDYSNSEQRRIDENRPVRSFTNVADSRLGPGAERIDQRPDYVKTLQRTPQGASGNKPGSAGFNPQAFVNDKIINEMPAIIAHTFGQGATQQSLNPEQRKYLQGVLKTYSTEQLDNAKYMHKNAMARQSANSKNNLKQKDAYAIADKYARGIATIPGGIEGQIDSGIYAIARESEIYKINNNGKKLKITPYMVSSINRFLKIPGGPKKEVSKENQAKFNNLVNMLNIDATAPKKVEVEEVVKKDLDLKVPKNSTKKQGSSAYQGTENLFRNERQAISKFAENTRAKQSTPGLANYGQGLNRSANNLREDGTEKSDGWNGILKMTDGSDRIMTELSISVNFDGKETLIPSIVPTLTKKELDYLRAGNDVTEAIVQKAVEHARKQIKAGNSPFKEDAQVSGQEKLIKKLADMSGNLARINSRGL